MKHLQSQKLLHDQLFIISVCNIRTTETTALSVTKHSLCKKAVLAVL